MFQKIKKIHKCIVGKIQSFIIAVVLPLTYIVGVGIPFFFRLIFRKRKKTGWQKASYDTSLESLKRQS